MVATQWLGQPNQSQPNVFTQIVMKEAEELCRPSSDFTWFW
jgi:hypothetical protein